MNLKMGVSRHGCLGISQHGLDIRVNMLPGGGTFEDWPAERAEAFNGRFRGGA